MNFWFRVLNLVSSWVQFCLPFLEIGWEFVEKRKGKWKRDRRERETEGKVTGFFRNMFGKM